MSIDFGKRMAEEVLEKFSTAVKNGDITLRKCLSNDNAYFYADAPDSKPRFTYAMLSPTENKKVIAVAVIVLDNHHSDGKTTWDITWGVDEKYRNQGYGKSISYVALDDFVTNMKGKLEGFAVEATVATTNEYSRKIGEALLGGEEIVNNSDGSKVYSYWKEF